MPDATITSTASTFGTITGTFAADQSTVTGTITAITGTVDGSVGVPGPQGQQGIQGIQGIQGVPGSPGAPGVGVPAAGNTGQVLQKLSATSYDTGWLTLPADFITSVTAPLDVTSGNLSVNLSAYLPLAGGYITGDIQSSNGSGYRTFDGLYSQVNISSAMIQLLNGNVGGGTLTVEWDGITFADGKQTVKYPGASILTGYALESWVTAGFYPLSGNPSGFLTDAPSDGSQYARKNAAWDVVIPGDRYLTTSTTSNTLSNTTKTFTIGTGLSYTPTQNLTISYDASNHMHGEVLTYNSGTGVLTVDINHHTGSGTYAAWVVNVGGVTPATSVAWGAITGTLSTQTDLQNALDLKLDVTTAASTYYLQTNPSGFIDASALTPYSTTVQADALYYPLVGNPSGFLTSVPPPSLTNLTSDISWDVSANTGRLLIAGVNDIGGGFTEARLNFTSAVPNQPSTGDFWFNGTDFFYQSGGVKTIASQSYVSATYQTLAGMSSYLTTASAAATYFTIASAANKADLASPTFTGTPTLPTGTIATTQSPGNNTTAVATTAFVTAAVPAFAATADINSPSSTTKVMSPSNVLDMMMHPGYQFLYLGNGTSGTSGSGSYYAANSGRWKEFASPGSSVAGYGAWAFDVTSAGWGYVSYSRGQLPYYHDWSKKIWLSGRAMLGNGSGTTYNGDANTFARISLGGKNSFYTGDNLASLRSISWKCAGGGSAAMILQVTNGSTLTNVTSSFTPVLSQVFDWKLYSDGSGNVTLYINDSQVATTSAGPTGNNNYGLYYEMADSNGSNTKSLALETFGTKLFYSV